jgi:gamma-glutamyltranspeptidase / glutathione hydrolase
VAPAAQADRGEGQIATPHHLATGIGAAALRAGGNAVDAAVAAGVALAVVAPYECGVGGDLFALVWDGSAEVYNGSGRAPAGIDPERLRADAGGQAMPAFGPDAVTVPGAVAGWFDLLDRYGSRSFAELAAPAVELARGGFALSERGVRTIRRAGKQSRSSAAWRAIYEPALERRTLVQPDLARLLGRLEADGPDAFYRGEIAGAIAAAVRAAGGALDGDDLRSHRGEWVRPVSAGFRGHRVHQAPPNSQGIAALEALAALESEPLESLGAAERHWLLVAAARLAVAERDRFVADPDHMAVAPSELLAATRIEELGRALGGPDPAGRAPEVGDLGQTAYLCCADRDGLLVSLIQSNFIGFGAGITVPGWGVNLHNRGAGFTLAPGHPNEAGARKRPLHTLMPALITAAGEPTHLLGTMGGTNQIAIQLQLLTALLVDGDAPAAALRAPRWALGGEGELLAEPELVPLLRPGAAERGHSIVEAHGVSGDVGYAQALVAGDGAAAADPRSEGAASGDAPPYVDGDASGGA